MSLVDYSDLEGEIKDAPAPTVLPDNSEAKIRIIAVDTGESEKNNGCKYYMPRFDVPSDPMVKEFNYFLWDPISAKEKLDEKKVAKNKFSLKEFFTCFKVDLSKPFSWEDDLIAREGWAILGISKDEQYGDKNFIKKFVNSPGSSAKSDSY